VATCCSFAVRRSVQRQESGLVDGRSDIAVLFVDLNKFNVINDQFGHVVGDRELPPTYATEPAQITARY